MTDSRTRTIVIVGAGFTGTVTAINLLRLAREEPLRIVLVDRGPVARGVAYAKRRYPFALNVPAGRMSATATDPQNFLHFAQRRVPGSHAESFLPRELYGEYLEASLIDAQLMAAPQVRLECIRGVVIGIERAHRTRMVHVWLADGRNIHAHEAVLALGNPPPAPLPGAEALRGSPRYVADPWVSQPGFRPGETVLLAGTGLTMADMVLAGIEAARGNAAIHALSRHGLLPLAQTTLPHVRDGNDHSELLLGAASVSARRLVRAVRVLSRDIEHQGGDPREVIALVRALAPVLWRRLNARERQRFLRHARSYWDVHRHRLPQTTWTALQDLRSKGKLHIHAGRLLDMKPEGNRIRVIWRARGATKPQTLLVDRVVNCTGPNHDPRRSSERLLRSLVAQRIAVPDSLGLGVLTDERYALVDSSGRGAGNIYYLGPMLRPAAWETTAVQELREHAARLAQQLLRRSIEVLAGDSPGAASFPAIAPRPHPPVPDSPGIARAARLSDQSHAGGRRRGGASHEASR